MGRKTLLLMTLGVTLLLADRRGPGQAAEANRPDVPVERDRLRPGTTQADVRRWLGPPKHTARQILYRRYLEQWIYEGPGAVRIEFDCVRGKEPQILTVHPLTPPRP